MEALTRMRNGLVAAIAALMIIAATGCTHDDGAPALEWYGYWTMQQLTVDGTPEITLPPSNGAVGLTYTFAFQNDILKITRSNERHDYMHVFATWGVDEAAGTLLIDFDHSGLESDDALFTPYAELHISDDAVTAMHIDSFGDGKAQLSFTDTAGQTVVITLKKSY